MRTRLETPAARLGLPQSMALSLGGLGFDWAMALLSTVFLGGLFLDGWAHNHDQVDESFFTPWHAFFYSGFLLIALLLVATLVINRRAGEPWPAALPTGYAPSLLGVLIFTAGGVGDLLWHEFFGVEADFEALFSPSHLALGIGLGLIVSGPLRAAWARPGMHLSWREAAPALLSLASLISALTFFTMYAHPLASNIASRDHFEWVSDAGQIAGTVSLFLTAMLLVGPVLLALLRWTLPAGALALVWGIDSSAAAIVNWHHSYTWGSLGAMLLAVLLVEGLRLRLRPSAARRGAFRLFALLAPILLVGSYIVTTVALRGTTWSIHLWTGAIVEAGLAGWLLSYLALPPPLPSADPS